MGTGYEINRINNNEKLGDASILAIGLLQKYASADNIETRLIKI